LPNINPAHSSSYRSSPVFLNPPSLSTTRQEEENHNPNKRAKFGTKMEGPLNVMESLIHNIFSCGCVDPNVAVTTTSSNQRKSVFASKPLGGYKNNTRYDNNNYSSKVASKGSSASSSTSTVSDDGSSYVGYNLQTTTPVMSGKLLMNNHNSATRTTMPRTSPFLEPPEIQRLTLKDANFDITFMTH
jgi:hypothetical protein